MRQAQKLTIEFDEVRAVEVFRTIADAWREHERWFAGMVPPERVLPEGVFVGSRLHGIWLCIFAFCNAAGDQSENISTILKRLWRDNLDLFDPDLKLKSDTGLLIPAIPYAKSYPERVERWLAFRDYMGIRGSDPRLFFPLCESREYLIAWWEQHQGIGHKIAQMLSIWFQEVSWDIEYQNPIGWGEFRRIPLFVADRHAMRMMIKSQVITKLSTDHHRSISRPISDFVCEICKKHGINWSDLAQGMWHLGAKICRKRPDRKGNPAASDAYCVANCPVEHLCRYTIAEGGKTLDRTGHIGWEKRVPRNPHLFSQRT